MKQKTKPLFLILATAIFCAAAGMFFLFWKTDFIYRHISNIKTTITEQQDYKYRNATNLDLNAYTPLEDEDDAWYTKYHFIAHGGGGGRWHAIHPVFRSVGTVLYQWNKGI